MVKGFLNPQTSKTMSARMQLLEITDNSTSRMLKSKVTSSVMDTVFPHPVRFKKIWHMSRGDKSLFAWKAIPPEGFIALGIVCSTTGMLDLCLMFFLCADFITLLGLLTIVFLVLYLEDPPEVQSLNCLPMTWCIPTKVVPQLIWNDSGAGGGKAGSMWAINALDMVTVVAGHDPPKDVYYELRNKRFFLNYVTSVMGGVVSFKNT